MEKKYTSNEEEQQDNILRELAISYGKYTEEEIIGSPPLTEEELKNALTTDEVIEIWHKYIDEKFSK